MWRNGLSAKIFAVFNCQRIDGGSYLQADLAMDCDSERHATAVALAWFLVFAVAIGLPCLYLFQLYESRHNLEQEQRYAFFWCVLVCGVYDW